MAGMTLAAGLAWLGEGATEGIAGIGKAAHANVAVFHFHAGQKPPAEIKGHDIIGQLHGKAQYLTLTHSTGLKDGDVIMVTSDVLRDGGTSVEDFGVDCQLTLHVKNDSDVTVAGLCNVFVYSVADKREVESKLLIKPVHIDSDDWKLVAWDEKENVAIYVDEEIGED